MPIDTGARRGFWHEQGDLSRALRALADDYWRRLHGEALPTRVRVRWVPRLGSSNQNRHSRFYLFADADPGAAYDGGDIRLSWAALKRAYGPLQGRTLPTGVKVIVVHELVHAFGIHHDGPREKLAFVRQVNVWLRRLKIHAKIRVADIV